MNVVVFIVEWVVSFIALFLLMEVGIHLFHRVVNRVTAVVFSFAIVMLITFIVAPYLFTFFEPAFIYIPILLFYFFYFLLKNGKKD